MRHDLILPLLMAITACKPDLQECVERVQTLGKTEAAAWRRNCLILRQVMRWTRVSHDARALVSPFFAIAVS
jgi:hypothetical protein